MIQIMRVLLLACTTLRQSDSATGLVFRGRNPPWCQSYEAFTMPF